MASNCTLFGGEEPIERSKLWSGLLAVFCSLICVVLMAADVITTWWHGWSKSWILCKFFTFNAMTLGLLGYATSVSLETEEPMPGFLDQLAKVSGVAFIGISMNHAMPSLGQLGEITILTNLIPLGLLVVNTSYNVWDQFKTGLVTEFGFPLKHCTIVMAIIYALLFSYSLFVSAIRKRLESQFESKHKRIVGEMENDTDPKFTTEKLEMYIKKYWLMAVICSPDTVCQTSPLFLPVAVSTIVSCCLFLVTLILRRPLPQWNCLSMSDYAVSTKGIFLVHGTGILVGLVIALIRSFSAVKILLFSPRANIMSSLKKYIKYSIQTPKDWRNQPLSSDYAICKGLFFRAKSVGGAGLMVINMIIGLIGSLAGLIIIRMVQILVLTLLVLVAAPLVIAVLLSIFIADLCRDFLSTGRRTDEASEDGPEDVIASLPSLLSGDKDGLQEYVLNLDWVDLDRRSVVRKWKGVPEKWIQNGKLPAELQSILEHRPPESSRIGQDFLGTFRTVVSSDEVLKNCWSLVLLTIECIIKALFHDHSCNVEMENLVEGVHQGFKYAKVVDENVTKPSDATLVAAEMVKQNLRYLGKWVDKDPTSIAGSGSFKEKIGRLNHHASEIDRGNEDLEKRIAAKSMHAFTRAMSEMFDDNDWQSFEVNHLKEALRIVLAECLTKLPEAIFHQCSRGSFGSRESAVKLAAQVLGETKGILKAMEMEPV